MEGNGKIVFGGQSDPEKRFIAPTIYSFQHKNGRNFFRPRVALQLSFFI